MFDKWCRIFGRINYANSVMKCVKRKQSQKEPVWHRGDGEWRKMPGAIEPGELILCFLDPVSPIILDIDGNSIK